MSKRCTHIWRPLCEPSNDDGRFYVILRRLSRYWTCQTCGRLSYWKARRRRPALVSNPSIEAMIRQRAEGCPK